MVDRISKDKKDILREGIDDFQDYDKWFEKLSKPSEEEKQGELAKRVADISKELAEQRERQTDFQRELLERIKLLNEKKIVITPTTPYNPPISYTKLKQDYTFLKVKAALVLTTALAIAGWHFFSSFPRVESGKESKLEESVAVVDKRSEMKPDMNVGEKERMLKQEHIDNIYSKKNFFTPLAVKIRNSKTIGKLNAALDSIPEYGKKIDSWKVEELESARNAFFEEVFGRHKYFLYQDKNGYLLPTSFLSRYDDIAEGLTSLTIANITLRENGLDDHQYRINLEDIDIK